MGPVPSEDDVAVFHRIEGGIVHVPDLVIVFLRQGDNAVQMLRQHHFGIGMKGPLPSGAVHRVAQRADMPSQ